jgi:hypothetical protein
MVQVALVTRSVEVSRRTLLDRAALGNLLVSSTTTLLLSSQTTIRSPAHVAIGERDIPTVVGAAVASRVIWG